MSAGVNLDPLASLRPWGFVVDLGGREYEIQPRSGAQWLEVLLPNPFDPSDILPGMLGEAAEEELQEALMAGVVSETEIRDACYEVITMASGRDWWWALTLVQSAATVWLQIYGQLVAQGVRFDSLPLGAVLDALYATIVSRMNKEQLQSFNSELSRPPAGQAPELSPEDEEAQFLNLMNTMKG